MPEMECEICAYWQREQQGGETGLCRRHSPSLGSNGNLVGIGLWPSTNSHDWCGEYEQKSGD